MKKIHVNNILILYLIQVLKGSFLLLPIIVLFFQDKGLNLSQIFLLQSLYALVVVALEIPTGIIGDSSGRRFSLLLSSFLGVVGWFGYHVSDGFISLLFAEIFLALSYCFYSGSDIAIMYDTLVEENKSEFFSSVLTRYKLIGYIKESAGGFVGGLLASISFSLITSIQIFFSLIIVVITFYLKEPKSHNSNRVLGIKEIYKHIRTLFIGDNSVFYLLVYSSIIGLGTMIRLRSSQVYYQALGLDMFRYGLLWGLGNMIIGFGVYITSAIQSKLHIRNILLLLLLLLVATFVLLGYIESIWGIFFSIIFYVVRGIADILFNDIINKEIDSLHRATILSIGSFMFRIHFMIIGPFVGFLLDIYGLQITFWSVAAFIFLYGIVVHKKIFY